MATGIAELQATQKLLDQRLNAVKEIDIAPLLSRLDAQETAIEDQSRISARNSSAIVEAGEKLAVNNQQIAALAEKLGSVQPSQLSGGAGEIAALAKRLAAIESMPNTSSADGNSGLQVALERLADKITALEKSASTARRQANTSLANLQSDQLKSTGNIDALASRLLVLEDRIAAVPDDQKLVARAIAAANLKSAIDSGGGFGDALALFGKIGGNANTVASLEKFAISGIPSLAMLRQSFSAISDKIVTAGLPQKKQGYFDELMTNARSLVKIKTTATIEGDGPAAIVSRIDAALRTANTRSAIDQWQKLPETARDVSADWAASLKARDLADGLIDDLLNSFIAGVSGNNN